MRKITESKSLEALKDSMFIDLTLDYGFKIVMADPDHTEFLLGLLNAIIPEREIVALEIQNPDVMPSDEDAHRVSYDIRCVDSDGNIFITEMQKEPYTAFRDRLMVYSGDPLLHLLKKSEHYDKVRTLYIVSILGSYLRVNGEPDDFHDRLLRRASVTMNESGFVLSDKPNWLFLQLSVAREPTPESTFIEKWAYYVSNMSRMREKPQGLEPYFDRLFDAANRENIEKGKLSIYDNMVRDAIQIQAEKELAIEEATAAALIMGKAEGKAAGIAEGKAAGIAEGKAAGIAEGKAELIRAMLANGMDAAAIANATGLSIEQVDSLTQNASAEEAKGKA